MAKKKVKDAPAGESARPDPEVDAVAASDADASPALPAGDAEPLVDEPPPPPRASAELKSIVEALIFASPDPLTLKTLLKMLDNEPREDVEAAVASLREDYNGGRGLQLVEVAGGYQIVTRPELHEWVRRLFHEATKTKLSVQALETLAVIAYKQPITAPEITEIRGVNTSGVVNTLLERRLVKIAGRKQVVGRPFLYATTREFLVRFGLKDLSDLPKVEDMAEVLGLDSLTLGEAQPAMVTLPFDDEQPPQPGAGALPEAEDEAADDDEGDTDETVH